MRSELSRFDRCSWIGCRTECVDEIELCLYHFSIIGQTYIEKRSIFGAAALAASKARREAERAERNADMPSKDDWSRERSVVYYVRLGDYVKIGYTIHLPERIGQFRQGRDVLLAVEPGWRETEAERHKQFAAERVSRREDFNPSRRLLAHIDVVRSKYGEPWSYTKRRVTAAGPQPIPA